MERKMPHPGQVVAQPSGHAVEEGGDRGTCTWRPVGPADLPVAIEDQVEGVARRNYGASAIQRAHHQGGSIGGERNGGNATVPPSRDVAAEEGQPEGVDPNRR